MPLSTTDLLTFVLFLGAVVFVSLRASRGRRTAEGYFLAGRNLGGWAIGMSLVATNISTEHFVGMSGSAATDIGLAIASYEWTAAAALIVIGWFLLPRYLKSGVFTMPEFLERRYDRGARTILAALLTAATVFVAMATVLYAGAVALNAIFLLPDLLGNLFGLSPDTAELAATLLGVWGIGLLASVYTIYGGLKAVVWSDFIQGIAILAGGVMVLWLGFSALGGEAGVLAGAARFLAENQDRLPHRAARRPPRGPLDRGVRGRSLDRAVLLLGSEPVHHPAHPGGAEPRRGTAGNHLRRLAQDPGAVPDLLPGNPRGAALRGPDRPPRSGISGARPRTAPAGAARGPARRARGSDHEFLQLDAELGVHDVRAGCPRAGSSAGSRSRAETTGNRRSVSPAWLRPCSWSPPASGRP